MKNSPWQIREAIGTDVPFIYSTWSNSYRYDSPLGKSCQNSIFFPQYGKVIDRILSHESTRVAIACKPEEPDVIFGYMVHQPNILHYSFTKEAFTGFGIARSLFEHLGGAQFCSHKTFMSQAIFNKHPELVYNPFLLFQQEIVHGKSE